MVLACFDLDDTLIQRTEAVRIGLADFLARHGLPLDDLEWIMELDQGGYRPRAVVTEAVSTRYRDQVDPAEVEQFWAEGAAPWVTLPDETRTALTLLREAGHRIALVTNGRTQQQSAKVATCRLAPLLDAIVISEEAGTAKPAAEIFRIAADRAGADLSDGWMVGDNAANDIGGGRAAGLRTIWIPNDKDWPIVDFEPDARAMTSAAAAEIILNS